MNNCMEQQRILRSTYNDYLVSGIKDGSLVDLFKNIEFQLSDSDTLLMPHIETPVLPHNAMNVDSALDSAISLFTAYRALTPIEAADPRFWNYLAIKDFYAYLGKRWPNVIQRVEDVKENKYILDHFIIGSSSSLLRSWLSGLWWSVYLSADEKTPEDPYRLTKVLFWNETFRTRTLGTYLLSRNKEVFLGVLEYFQNRGLDSFSSFDEEHRPIIESLNRIGGTKSILVYSREEIADTMTELFPY